MVQEQVQSEKLARMVYAYLRLPFEREGEVVNMGYTHVQHIPEAVKYLMEKWVEFQDRKLDLLEPNSEDFAQQFGQRGVSFQEFKILKRGDVHEENFKHYRAFDYLFIPDRIEHVHFTASLSDENDDFENYMATLVPFLFREIPVLYNFFFNFKLPLYFPISSLQRHTYIVGKSGSGKSELLKIPFYDLQRRSQKKRSKTLILIEPHGDLASQVLRFVMNKGEGRSRVILIDPVIRDTAKQVFEKDILGEDYTFVINPFELNDHSETNINYMVQELGSAFYEIVEEESSPQMKALLNACLDTLLRKKDATISDLKRFMDDQQNADLVALGQENPNPEYKTFFQTKFQDSRLASTKSSIYFKLQSIIGNPQFRRMMVGKSTINLEKAINSGKVLIFNLSKGRMGKEGGPAYGKLLIALIQGIMRKRQDIPAEKRKQTFLFIDEFQNYITPTIEEIMAESRKYALHLFLANQVVGQKMDANMKRIILGNTAIKISSHNEPDTIDIMCKQMGELKPKDFQRLPQFSFYLYDSSKPLKGTMILKSPSFLVDQESRFYMTKPELAALFKYFVQESGYYIPVKSFEQEQEVAEHVESGAGQPGILKRGTLIYDPNFKR